MQGRSRPTLRRHRVGISVLAPWSAPTPEQCHSTNYPHVFPQVSALQVDQDRTPKAGVGSSNLPRPTRAFVDEDVLAAGLGGDEPEALVRVVPGHGAVRPVGCNGLLSGLGAEREQSAWGPFSPSTTMNATRCPSEITPPPTMAELCTKISAPPPSGVMKPIPLPGSYQVTVPSTPTGGGARAVAPGASVGPPPRTHEWYAGTDPRGVGPDRAPGVVVSR